MTTSFTRMPSPLGPLLLVKRAAGLAGVYMPDHTGGPLPDSTWREDRSRFDREVAQLSEYFAGARTRFELDLDLEGTSFQRGVWRALVGIPHGETITYGALAIAVGRPSASRAVGAANGRNPVSIVVPCHRVVGAGGALSGYAGGPERKRWLIDWERRTASLSGRAETA
jgi:methylated-DNA-[protein]-cysteine S-methyltransferase